jgi:hypothetical protein
MLVDLREFSFGSPLLSLTDSANNQPFEQVRLIGARASIR